MWMPYNPATPLTTLSILLTQPVVATYCMVPTLSNQSANPVVPTLPVVQANVALLGVAATIDAVRGSNSATPLWIPTLPAVQVNEPLLSRSRPTYDGIAAPADYADLDKRAASPSYMDSRVCVRGLTRTRQRVIPLRCMGAMPDTHLPRDRPRWCHWTAFKEMGCRLCLGGRLQVIPCGIAAGPRLRKPPMEEGMALLCQICNCAHKHLLA